MLKIMIAVLLSTVSYVYADSGETSLCTQEDQDAGNCPGGGGGPTCIPVQYCTPANVNLGHCCGSVATYFGYNLTLTRGVGISWGGFPTYDSRDSCDFAEPGGPFGPPGSLECHARVEFPTLVGTIVCITTTFDDPAGNPIAQTSCFVQ